MKTIYVKYYEPRELYSKDTIPELTEEQAIGRYFRAYKYADETTALMAYANTMCTWSTLLDDSMIKTTEDMNRWINEAYKHIKDNDYDWLERNFT